MINKYKISKYNIDINLKNNSKLIYNSLSQFLSLLDEAEVNLYNKACSKHIENLTLKEETMLDSFLINNFLVPLDIDETNTFEKLYNRTRYNKENMNLTILPTLNCNFSCDYCFEGKNKATKMMDTKVQDSIINFIKRNSKDLKNISITWFGGEPLLGINIIKRMSDKIIAYADTHGINYSAMIVTNGYLLTPEIAAELYVRRIKTIQITLDGSKDHHNKIRYVKSDASGSFDRIVENIKGYIHEIPINTSLRVNIDKRNKDDIVKLINDLSNAGIKNKRLSMYFSPIESSTAACSDICNVTIQHNEFAHIEHELSCLANKKGLCTFPFLTEWLDFVVQQIQMDL